MKRNCIDWIYFFFTILFLSVTFEGISKLWNYNNSCFIMLTVSFAFPQWGQSIQQKHVLQLMKWQIRYHLGSIWSLVFDIWDSIRVFADIRLENLIKIDNLIRFFENDRNVPQLRRSQIKIFRWAVPTTRVFSTQSIA